MISAAYSLARCLQLYQ